MFRVTGRDTKHQQTDSITLTRADYSDYLEYQAIAQQSLLSGTSQQYKWARNDPMTSIRGFFSPVVKTFHNWGTLLAL